MYYQALFKIDGLIKKVSAIYTNREECEEMAKELVHSANNWYYNIIEQEVYRG